MRHRRHRTGAIHHGDAAEDRPSQLFGRVGLGLDAGCVALQDRVERLDHRPGRIRVDQQPGADQQLMQQTHPEADRGSRLAWRLVLQERSPVLLGAPGELAAGGDDDQRQAPGACLARGSQRLHRLTRVTGCHEQRPIARPGRELVVAVHDQRDAQPVARDAGDQIATDRAPAHRQHEDRIDVSVARLERGGRRDATRLGELPRQLSHPAQHVADIDP